MCNSFLSYGSIIIIALEPVAIHHIIYHALVSSYDIRIITIITYSSAQTLTKDEKYN